ncbi:TcaA NTF2-like domain-containing protein [Lentibacillus salinarum]|uniref:Zinc-ribbon domain-containing protein n=1 Tax=Lentibacillus salinarum TaxID=446820 RepID=A0ABW3ZVE2_9BACI
MNYCTECGHPLEQQHHFCINCGAEQAPVDGTPADGGSAHDEGHPTGQEADMPSADHSPPKAMPEGQSQDGHQADEQPTGQPPEQQSTRSSVKQTAAGPPRKPMKKRTKILIAAAVVFVGVLFGTHKALSSYFDPMKDLQAMDQAVAGDDAEAFVSYIDVANESLLDEQAYMQYIKEYEWEAVKAQYSDIIQADDSLTSTITNIDGEPLFTAQPEGRLLGLYTTYSLKAEPTMLAVHTTMEDTEISIGDESATINPDEPKEWSLYPGSYAITGTAGNMFGEFTYDDSVEILTQKTTEMTLEFSGSTHSFSTNQPEATLFVEGEDTGTTLGEIDTLGPIPEDNEISMHAEWTSPDGDVVKSETVTQNDAQFIGGIPFSFDKSEMEEADTEEAAADISGDDAGDTVLDFRDAYEKAVNTKDYSLIESFILEGSEAEDELQEYIGDLKETDYDYDFTSNEVLDVEEVDDETVNVTTNEVFVFTNHRDEQTDYDRVKTYTVKLEDGDYKISLIEYDETNRD